MESICFLLVVGAAHLSPWAVMAVVIGATMAIAAVFSVAAGMDAQDEEERGTLFSLSGPSSSGEPENRK